jgi:CubicO group peptidase (beta-lactamase class C family)
MRAFIAANLEPPPNAPAFADDVTNNQMTSFAQSGGYVVRKVANLGSAAIRVDAQAKWTGAWSQISVYVTAKPPEYKEAAAPFHIVGLGLQSELAPKEFLEHQPLSDAELRSRIANLLHTLAAHDQFSGTVTVARANRVIFQKAAGLASRAWNLPNQPDTKFNLASITKMFTAVAVAQLVDHGKLRFDEKVGDVLTDYPNKDVATKVTIAELLSHTSGLIGSRDQFENHPEPESAKTIEERLKTFQNLPLNAEPGQKFDYSNAGYTLLGAIIEKASGQTYYAYLRDHLFKPAGMKNTDFYELATDPPNLAEGFEDAPNGTRLNNLFDLGSGLGSPAGGASSNGEDMVRFSTSLTTGKLVRKQTLDRLWSPAQSRPDRHDQYAFGAEISDTYGWKTIGHGGGWKGITNRFDILPTLGVTIVVLTNYDDDPDTIAFKIREWLTQGHPSH